MAFTQRLQVLEINANRDTEYRLGNISLGAAYLARYSHTAPLSVSVKTLVAIYMPLHQHAVIRVALKSRQALHALFTSRLCDKPVVGGVGHGCHEPSSNRVLHRLFL